MKAQPQPAPQAMEAPGGFSRAVAHAAGGATAAWKRPPEAPSRRSSRRIPVQSGGWGGHFRSDAGDRASVRWWVVFVLAAAAMLYTHYFGAFLLAAYGLCWLVGWLAALRPDPPAILRGDSGPAFPAGEGEAGLPPGLPSPRGEGPGERSNTCSMRALPSSPSSSSTCPGCPRCSTATAWIVPTGRAR